jgi:phage gp37-like protein
MGLRRLRGRLDQIQGSANLTLQDARDLLADLQDGFGVTVQVDANAMKTLMDMFLAGKECKLPLTIKIDPTIDTKE